MLLPPRLVAWFILGSEKMLLYDSLISTKCQGFPGAGFKPNTLIVFSGKDMKE